MKAPTLGTQLVLEAPVRVPDGGGGFALDWQALGTLWAELTATGAAEEQVGAREAAKVTHRVTVRGAAAGSPRRPQPSQRFRNGARVFAILGVASSPDGAWLTAWVEEGILS